MPAGSHPVRRLQDEGTLEDAAAILLRFKDSGNATAWPEKVEGWVAEESGTVCEWAGVICHGSRVTGLNLGYTSAGRGLTDRSYKRWLSGDVTILVELSEVLIFIDLCGTQVSGSVEPLATCTRLRHLDLHGTQVSGSVEPLAACTQLEVLFLQHS
eukprot:COSAG02_NODE_22390_length_754_cov_1.042748_2_plen_155_part_01